LMNDAIALSLFLELDARQGGAVRDDAELRARFTDYDTLSLG